MPDQAAIDHERDQVQALLEAPPGKSVRNINYDTHQGEAPQRPYARLEDRMGQFNSGWQSYDALKAALAGAPGDGNDIYQRGDGLWVREIWVHTGEQTFAANGDVENVQESRERGVALSMEQARAASAGGFETDYWNGFTWLRRGRKPEKDPVISSDQPNRKRRTVRASAADRALARQGDAARHTAAMANVVEPPAESAHAERSRTREK